jgi:hypothetical protein
MPTSYLQYTSILRQEYSWGRFLIAPNVFHDILSRNKVFVCYLEFVRAFGYKDSDDKYVQDGCRWQISSDMNSMGKTPVFKVTGKRQATSYTNII